MSNILDKKWKEDKNPFKRICNTDLDCKDCKFKYDDEKIFKNTSVCEKFPAFKPSNVLKGEKCTEKEVE